MIGKKLSDKGKPETTISHPARASETPIMTFLYFCCCGTRVNKKPIWAGIFKYLSVSSDIFRHLHISAGILRYSRAPSDTCGHLQISSAYINKIFANLMAYSLSLLLGIHEAWPGRTLHLPFICRPAWRFANAASSNSFTSPLEMPTAHPWGHRVR